MYLHVFCLLAEATRRIHLPCEWPCSCGPCNCVSCCARVGNLKKADRLLEVGFRDELNEIITACPRDRQTMLFSATMTDEVEDLVSLSLNQPVRLFVNKNSQVTSNLTQEFVRIRETRESAREAIVLSLCTRSYTSKCLIFVQAKAMAHRLRIILGLAGLKAGELHGSLTQAQRLQSLSEFTRGDVDFLVSRAL